MAIKDINTLKGKFADDKEPNGADFGDFMDSYYHRSSRISQNNVLGLNDTLNNKVDRDELVNMGVGIKGYGDDVQNVADLQTVPDKYEGLAVVVINDKDEFGNSYIWLYDGTKWGRTPYTALPKDVLTDKNLLPVLGANKKATVNSYRLTDTLEYSRRKNSSVDNLAKRGINKVGFLFDNGMGSDLNLYSNANNRIGLDRKFSKAEIYCLSDGGLKMVLIDPSDYSVFFEQSFDTVKGDVLTITADMFTPYSLAGNTKELEIYFQNLDNSKRALSYLNSNYLNTKVLVNNAVQLRALDFSLEMDFVETVTEPIVSKVLEVNNLSNDIANLAYGKISESGQVFTNGSPASADIWGLFNNTISESKKFNKAEIYCVAVGSVTMMLVNESTLATVAQKTFTCQFGINYITPAMFSEFDFAGNTQNLGIYFTSTVRMLAYRNADGINSKIIANNELKSNSYEFAIKLYFDESIKTVESGQLFNNSTSAIDTNIYAIYDNIIDETKQFLQAQIYCLTGGGVTMMLVNESTLGIVAQKTFASVAGQVLTITPAMFSEFNFEANKQELGIYFKNGDSTRNIAYKFGSGLNCKIISNGSIITAAYLLAITITKKETDVLPIVKTIRSLNNRVQILETGTSDDFDIYTAIANNNEIVLPPKTIEINKSIYIPANRKITGVRGATVLKLTGEATSIFNLDANSRDIDISGVTLQGRAAISKAAMTPTDIRNKTGAGTDCGIYTTGYAKNVHIHNCEFINFSLACIRLYRTHSLYTRTYKITDCVFGESYIGFLSDVRSEYHTVTGCTFAYNRIGCFIAGGNNFMGVCHFDGNSVGCVISGTAGENDSHGSIVGSSFNHNQSYGLCILDANNGFTFSGCHLFDGKLLIDKSKGIIINNAEIAATSIDVTGSTTALISNSVFIKNYGGIVPNYPDAETMLSLKNNFYIDGSDTSAINN